MIPRRRVEFMISLRRIKFMLVHRIAFHLVVQSPVFKVQGLFVLQKGTSVISKSFSGERGREFLLPSPFAEEPYECCQGGKN